MCSVWTPRDTPPDAQPTNAALCPRSRVASVIPDLLPGYPPSFYMYSHIHLNLINSYFPQLLVLSHQQMHSASRRSQCDDAHRRSTDRQPMDLDRRKSQVRMAAKHELRPASIATCQCIMASVLPRGNHYMAFSLAAGLSGPGWLLSYNQFPLKATAMRESTR